MRNLRNLLLVASGIVLAACATRTFRPDEAPEYVTTRDPTPFFLNNPEQAGVPDASLKAQTRVKLLRKKTGYSLVLLEDSRTGYVANAYITPSPPGSQERPFGSSPADDSQTRRKRRASPSPTPQPGQVNEVPPSESNVPPASPSPTPGLHAPPEAVPSPTPVPEVPLEKPKFRL